MKDDLEKIDLDKEINSAGKAASNSDPKEDLTVTKAQARVEELERELQRLKAAKAAAGGSEVAKADSEASTGGSRKTKTNAEAYASSEKNIADMLAEYDAITADDSKMVRRNRENAPRPSRGEHKVAAGSGKSQATQKPASAEKRHVEEIHRSPSGTKRQVEEIHRSPSGTKRQVEEIHRSPSGEKKSHEAAAGVAATVHETARHEGHKNEVPKHETVKHEGSHTDKRHDGMKHDKASRHDISRNSNRDARHLDKASAGNAERADHSGKKKEKKKGGLISRLSGMDYVIGLTGVLVLVAAILTINIYSTVKNTEAQIAAFATVGENLSGIGIAGESALLAMADNREMENIVIEEEEEYTVTEYDEKETENEGNVTVNMKLQTVVKDLKIKFINKSTGKLVPGVPFEVEITDSAKKTTTMKDDDKDGIIYIKSIAAGEAKVKMAALTGYDAYSLPKDIQTIVIKETLDYKKIDVADEIKTEAQVNAAAEDTAQATVTESSLTDTVAWVESTRTPIEGGMGYDVVKRDELDPIPDAVKNGKPSDSASAAPGIRVFTDKARDLLKDIDDLWCLSVYAEESENTTEEQTTAEQPSSEQPSSEEKKEEPSSEEKKEESDGEIDWSKPLTKNGIALYLDKECTTKATYKDYSTQSEFYLKNGTQGSTAGFKYTGWQTIDGATYFFDADGNKVTGDQVIQGAKYSFGSDGALKTGSGVLGIDVSKWNGSINWSQVKNSGISYVIIRCGYRGSTTGALIEDPTFRSNIKGAQSAGLKVGVYFFTQATSEVEAVEEASMTLNLISGYKLSYPVFLDVEPSGGRGDKIDAGTRTKVINAYCQTIRNSGYSAGVYANKTWLSEKFSPGSLSGCKIWLAQYAETPTYGGSYQMWQYSSKGKVSGISGNVDMNLSYMNY